MNKLEKRCGRFKWRADGMNAEENVVGSYSNRKCRDVKKIRQKSDEIAPAPFVMAPGQSDGRLRSYIEDASERQRLRVLFTVGMKIAKRKITNTTQAATQPSSRVE